MDSIELSTRLSTTRVLRSFTALLALGLCVSCATGQTTPLQQRIATSRRESEPHTLQSRAQGYAAAGDYTRAAQYFEAALGRGGNPDVILPLLVSVQVKDHNYRAAAQHLQDRLRSHPSDFRARFVLASLWCALEQPREAERELLRILEGDPSFSEATFALAVVYRDYIRDELSADRYFERYLAIEPNGRHREEAMGASSWSAP